jgi:DNA-binding transcriptional LysR family regulator
MKVTPKQLAQVVALDRHRHFGIAAEHLGISQPALSRSIQSLENRLGSLLFTRSRTGVKPTTGGRLLLKHARSVLQASADMESELRTHQGRRERELSLAIGLYPAELSLVPALRSLLAGNPELKMKLEVVDWVRAYELLRQGLVELVLCERSGHEDFAHQPVNQRRVYFAVRPEHPLLGERELSLEQVLAHPWACSRIPMRAAANFLVSGLAAGEPHPGQSYFAPAITAPSLGTALRLAAATDMVTITALTVVEPFLRSGQLQLLPLNLPWMRLNYGFAWLPEVALSQPARMLMECILEAERALMLAEQSLAEEFVVRSDTVMQPQ